MRSVFYETPIYLSLYKINEDSGVRENFPSHQGFEMIYVHQVHGEPKFIIGPRIYPVKPGDFLLIKPNQYHRLTIREPDRYLRSMIKFDNNSCKDILIGFSSFVQLLETITAANLESQVVKVGSEPSLEQFFKASKERLSAMSKTDLSEEKGLFLLNFLSNFKPYLLSMVSHLEAPVERTPVEHVMSWINHNYATNFTLEELAKMIHLSPYYLSHTFSEETGLTITKYTTVIRIRQACILLKDTNLSVREIGERVGISNYPYFCHLFKKYLQISPLQYRKAQQGIFPGF